jgi:hypothetical protein
MHTYKKGDHVVVLNQTQGGRFLIEGWATKEPTYVRKGQTIRNLKTDEAESFKSISQAKRRSREIQQANGKLGDGFLRVQHFS